MRLSYIFSVSPNYYYILISFCRLIMPAGNRGGPRGTLGSFGELFFWGTSGNLGDFPKVSQNSPKVPQKNYQILPMIVGIVFCSFRLFYIFTYLYVVLCIAFLQKD